MLITVSKMKIRCHSIRKLLFLIIFCGICAYIIINVLLRINEQSIISGDSSANRRIQIHLMERSIKSPLNRGKCVIPQLPINNPTILAFDKKAPDIDCGNALDDWVMCEKHICFVKSEVYKQKGVVSCTFRDILRATDKRNTMGRTYSNKDIYILQKSDFVKVSCVGSDGSGWNGLIYGVRPGIYPNLWKPPPKILSPVPVFQNFNEGEEILNKNEKVEKHIHQYNVLIYGFDSLSSNAFKRKLPKTYKYLVEELQAHVLKGYNIVGDGTAQALIPMLTGYTELELPDTRWRVPGTYWVDEAYPLIWKEYERNGYITSFNEDLPDVGTFTYRLKGFRNQPVHHYLRPFYIENNLSRKSTQHCIDHQPDHVVMLNYTKNIINTYSDVPYFIFSFHGGLSHDDYNLIGAADNDVLKWLKDLHKNMLLNNTILIFMSDHGNRFAEVRKTLQGKQEERLPFFSFSFPKTFQQRFPTEYATFLQNINRLTTPFDIHATLTHILELQKKLTDDQEYAEYFKNNNEMDSNYNDKNKIQIVEEMTQLQTKMSSLARNRAISLLKKIPIERSCADAYIEMHWCTCLNWQPINLTYLEQETNGIVLKAATSIVNAINNATKSYSRFCEVLQLDQIHWILYLSVNSDLLHYKKSIDKDGFVPEIDDNIVTSNIIQSINSTVLYQLQISLTPGNGLFEASVSHDRSTDLFDTKLSQISRVNRYGNQARCIYNRNPELRKYCFCRDGII